MKKSKVLSTTTKLRDLSFDDLYDTEDTVLLKAERLNIQKWRRLRREGAAQHS
jgi:hypothetical protein